MCYLFISAGPFDFFLSRWHKEASVLPKRAGFDRVGIENTIQKLVKRKFLARRKARLLNILNKGIFTGKGNLPIIIVDTSLCLRNSFSNVSFVQIFRRIDYNRSPHYVTTYAPRYSNDLITYIAVKVISVTSTKLNLYRISLYKASTIDAVRIHTILARTFICLSAERQRVVNTRFC